MTDEEYKEFLDAVNIVCLNCYCGNDNNCEECPVRITMNNEMEDRMTPIEKMNKLISVLSRKNRISDHIVEIFKDDNDSYSFAIYGKDWSNQLNYEEAEDVIYNVFKGIEIGKGLQYIEDDMSEAFKEFIQILQYKPSKEIWEWFLQHAPEFTFKDLVTIIDQLILAIMTDQTTYLFGIVGLNMEEMID